MGYNAFYEWKDSPYTLHVSNNRLPKILTKFYDTLDLAGHFENSPTFASNKYTNKLYDETVRIPISSSKFDGDKLNRGGVRPVIGLTDIPRKYLDFWTLSGTTSVETKKVCPPVGTTNIDMLEFTPRLCPQLSDALFYLDYQEHKRSGKRPIRFWEITLKLSNEYPFGWYARYIGDESAYINEFGDLYAMNGYTIYQGIPGQTQKSMFKVARNRNTGEDSFTGNMTDMFMPVKIQKTGGTYDELFIPYIRSLNASSSSGNNTKLSNMIKSGFMFFGAHLSLDEDIHFIYATYMEGDFTANPWCNVDEGIGLLTDIPYRWNKGGFSISFTLAPKSVWEEFFTGSGMPWSYDVDKVTSPDDGGLIKPSISGLPDNPIDDDTPGTGDNTSDSVEYPNPLYIPNATVYDRYFLTPNQVPDVKKFLFSDTFVDNVRRLWTNPAEYVISLVCYPFDVASTGLTTTSGVVSVGGVSSNIAAAALTDKGVPYFYGGSVYVDKYYNSYLDYEPYTSIDIYIPYIGVRPLNVSQVVGHKLCIGYYIDLNTQQITALIGLDGVGGNLGQVVTQFVGSIGIQTPLSGTSAQDMIRNIVAQTSGLITGVGAIAGGVMSANPALLASGVASTSNALLGGGHTAPSYYGSLSPVSGLYTPQVAYLIINRPRQALPAAYLTQQGFSSNYSGKVSQFSGYLECASVNIASTTTMTAQEQQEIINLLTGGIYCG